MKAVIDPSEKCPIADPTPVRVTIVYEDMASGMRARDVAERLARFLGSSGARAESIWRSDLLALPVLAEQAASAAAECDYLIVSLCGEELLPFAARRWIEEQLEGAAERGMGLILLSNSHRGRWRVVDATRHDFRCLCEVHRVAFFAHTVSAPPPESDLYLLPEANAFESHVAELRGGSSVPCSRNL